MGILYFLAIIATIGCYWLIYMKKHNNNEVFSKEYRYPSREMDDGMTYYPIEQKKLALRSSLFGITPVIIIGASSVTLFADSLFLVYFLIGIALMFFVDMLVERLSLKNNGREIHDVIRNTFGETAYKVVYAGEALFRIIYVIALMYLSTYVLSSIMDVSVWFVAPVVIGAWVAFITYTSLAQSRNIALLGSAGVALITIVSLIALFKDHGLTSLNNNELYFNSGSMTIERFSIFAVVVVGLASPRSIRGITEITRHATSQHDSHIAVASQRSSQLLMLVIWSVISMVIFNSFDTAAQDVFVDASIFGRVEILFNNLFGSIAKWVFIVLAICSILSMEVDAVDIRIYLIRRTRFGISRDRSKAISTATVAGFSFLVAFLINIIDIEMAMWNVFAITSVGILAFYFLMLSIYALRVTHHNNFFAPFLGFLFMAYVLTFNFHFAFKLNADGTILLLVSSIFASLFITVIGFTLLFQNPMHQYENDHAEMKNKIGWKPDDDL